MHALNVDRFCRNLMLKNWKSPCSPSQSHVSRGDVCKCTGAALLAAGAGRAGEATSALPAAAVAAQGGGQPQAQAAREQQAPPPAAAEVRTAGARRYGGGALVGRGAQVRRARRHGGGAGTTGCAGTAGAQVRRCTQLYLGRVGAFLFALVRLTDRRLPGLDSVIAVYHLHTSKAAYCPYPPHLCA